MCEFASARKTMQYRSRAPGGRTNAGTAGFSIVESVLSVALVGVLLTVALNSVGASLRSQTVVADSARAEALAAELMAEILAKPYSDPDETPVFGVETSENATNKKSFDDVDDYAGWTEATIVDSLDALIPGFAGWSRQAAVAYVQPENLRTTHGSDLGLKQIRVVVRRDGATIAELRALRSRAWANAGPQSMTD